MTLQCRENRGLGSKIHCSPRDQSFWGGVNFVSRESQCFPRLNDLFYSKTKQKQILKNVLRFQRQHQVTSDLI